MSPAVALVVLRRWCLAFWLILVLAACSLHVVFWALRGWEAARPKRDLHRSAFAEELIRDALEYGKTKTLGGGPLNVPKRWFSHFYFTGWLVNVVVLGLAAWSRVGLEWARWLGLGLFQLHVSRRLYECLCVSRTSRCAQMHVLHYLLGLSFYVAVPATIASCVATSPGDDAKTPAQAWRRSLEGLAGVVLFLRWSWGQHLAHRQLADLRATVASSARYALPRGGAFTRLSCPHYLAEVFIYVAFAVVLAWDAAMLLIVVFVSVELTFSALRQHEWYKAKFSDYPVQRRAMWPCML